MKTMLFEFFYIENEKMLSQGTMFGLCWRKPKIRGDFIEKAKSVAIHDKSKCVSEKLSIVSLTYR